MIDFVFNLNNPNERNIKIFKFPDSQTHVEILTPPLSANVKVSLDGSDKIMLLLQTVDALKRAGSNLGTLKVLYYYGARSDRAMQGNDSIDALITAKLINSCGFKRVEVLDIHNEGIGLHIDNFISIEMPRTIDYKDYVLIIPDLGAYKKYHGLDTLDKIQCIKFRDGQGNINLKVLEAEKCIGKKCIIKDDLIDGGATFIKIVEYIRGENWVQQAGYTEIILECTHGIFSQGVEKLTQYFDKIIVTDSYTKQSDEVKNNSKIQIIKV